jgi:hypothetical protein
VSEGSIEQAMIAGTANDVRHAGRGSPRGMLVVRHQIGAFRSTD